MLVITSTSDTRHPHLWLSYQSERFLIDTTCFCMIKILGNQRTIERKLLHSTRSWLKYCTSFWTTRLQNYWVTLSWISEMFLSVPMCKASTLKQYPKFSSIARNVSGSFHCVSLNSCPWSCTSQWSYSGKVITVFVFAGVVAPLLSLLPLSDGAIKVLHSFCLPWHPEQNAKSAGWLPAEPVCLSWLGWGIVENPGHAIRRGAPADSCFSIC